MLLGPMAPSGEGVRRRSVNNIDSKRQLAYCLVYSAMERALYTLLQAWLLVSMSLMLCLLLPPMRELLGTSNGTHQPLVSSDMLPPKRTQCHSLGTFAKIAQLESSYEEIVNKSSQRICRNNWPVISETKGKFTQTEGRPRPGWN